MDKLSNIHPGEILQEQFLIPMNSTDQNYFDLEEQKKLKAREFKHIKRLKEHSA